MLNVSLDPWSDLSELEEYGAQGKVNEILNNGMLFCLCMLVLMFTAWLHWILLSLCLLLRSKLEWAGAWSSLGISEQKELRINTKIKYHGKSIQEGRLSPNIFRYTNQTTNQWKILCGHWTFVSEKNVSVVMSNDETTIGKMYKNMTGGERIWYNYRSTDRDR